MRGLLPIYLLLAVGLSAASTCFSSDFDLFYFKSITGEWVGDGELTNSEGDVTSIHEEWTAAPEDGSFAIRGTRQWGDDNLEFRWIVTLNASTELYECEYWQTGMDSEIIFEMSLIGKSAEMRTPFGETGGEILIANSVTSEGVEGLVKFTNANGEAMLEGIVKHAKKGS